MPKKINIPKVSQTNFEFFDLIKEIKPKQNTEKIKAKNIVTKIVIQKSERKNAFESGINKNRKVAARFKKPCIESGAKA